MKTTCLNPATRSRSGGRTLINNLYTGVLALLVLLTAAPVLPAGETSKSFKEEIIVVEELKPFDASLSTGWDSLYMFRGVNVLRGNDSYGSSLYWVDLNATWHITENDAITLGGWMAFGLDATDYKEFDAYIGYTRTIGNLSLGFGYIFYDVINGPYYSHELNWSAAYTFHLPAGITITPALIYYLNLGPDVDGNSGITESGSGFLQARIDAGIPIYKEIVALEPWIAFGASFGYNFLDDGSTLTGANNLEIGLSLPVQITEVISVSAYAAYSTQWEGLAGTRPNTFWGGASVNFSF